MTKFGTEVELFGPGRFPLNVGLCVFGEPSLLRRGGGTATFGGGAEAWWQNTGRGGTRSSPAASVTAASLALLVGWVTPPNKPPTATLRCRGTLSKGFWRGCTLLPCFCA